MDITSISREEIENGLKGAASSSEKNKNQTRLLFTPTKITDENFESVCKTYSQIGSVDFHTVVIVESTPGEAEKKLAMPSFKTIETQFGEINANIRLRNDFADEDDDFFINDDAFDDSVSLFQQLPILQYVLEDFSVLHVQITDERPPIIKELAAALQEILPSRNALLVVCCDLSDQLEINEIQSLLDEENISGFLNRLNRGETKIDGIGAWAAGWLVSKKWGLRVHFEPDSDSNVQSGYAVVQNQPIFR